MTNRFQVIGSSIEIRSSFLHVKHCGEITTGTIALTSCLIEERENLSKALFRCFLIEQFRCQNLEVKEEKENLDTRIRPRNESEQKKKTEQKKGSRTKEKKPEQKIESPTNAAVSVKAFLAC